MSSYFDDASLVMIPSGYKTSKVYSVKPTDGSGDLTFSRSNDTATRVNSAGLIEKVRTNLVLQSNTLSNASWTKTNMSVTGGQTGYDGSANAWLYTEGTFTGSLPDLFQSYSTSTNIETYSFYAKAGTKNWIIVSIGLAGFTFINLSDGSIGSSSGGSPLTVTTQSLGGGWYRVRAVSPTGSKNGLSIHLTTGDTVTSYNGNGTGTIFIQNIQRETGDIATSYIATTSAAVSVGPVANVPRLDYLNSSCPRLLLEPQRTNLVTYSEQFDNADWNKETGNTVVANSVVSPDGYTNADSISASSGNVLNVNQSLPTPASTASYTFSGFFKKQSSSSVEIYLFQVVGGFVARASINLDAGTITASVGTATITNYGNGWYRASVTGTFTGSVISTCGIYNQSTTGTRNVYAYGCQVEASAAYATSYIPTLGASVTRGADACLTASVPSLIGQTEGTLFVEWERVSTQQAMFVILSNLAGTTANSYTNSIYLYQIPNTNLVVENYVSGVQQFGFTKTGLSVGTHKLAVAYKANDFVCYVDGVQIGTDTSGSVPVMNYLTIGGGADVPVSGQTIKQTLLFKTRLSNADLAALTTI